MAGQFITIEGIEGVGKTSNMRILLETIRAAGIGVVTTREPGGTPLAEQVRDVLVNPTSETMSASTELLLMFAARGLNVENVIRPAVARGDWVVCDRFTDSSRAYQGGGRGMAMETIDQLAEWVHGDCWPALTVLLDTPVAVGLARAKQRGAADRFEQERVEFFERVRNCYLELAAAEPERIVVIDANRSLDIVNAEVAEITSHFIENTLSKTN